MKICRTKAELRAFRATLRDRGASVALVPTMGALHAGHLSLVEEARRRADETIATIFVNPMQFNNPEDLAKYPRDDAADLDKLTAAGVAGVFMPSVDEMYGAGTTEVHVRGISDILMGALRPGHFKGVTTVVNKLFNVVQPDIALFGEKDYQQLAIIRLMVRDLDMPIEIVGVPTMREADGLAMSSRNVRLKPEHRQAAVALSQALDLADDLAAKGITRRALEEEVYYALDTAPHGLVRSVDVRDALTLETLHGVLTQPAVVLLAVEYGDVLLIDQRVLHPPKEVPR